MPKPPAPIEMTFPLAAGHVGQFTFQRPDLLCIEITPWPHFATRSEALDFLRSYIAARACFLEIIATVTGLRVAVLDNLGDGFQTLGPTIAPATAQ